MDLRCKYSPTHRVAITGATGFIGSRLVNCFGAEHFIAIPFEDIGESAVVIHLAADVSPSRVAMLNNIATDSWLLEILNKKHRGLIYASSNNVYPFALDCRIHELSRFNDFYAASKIFGEKLVSEWCQVPAVCVRIADVFGVGQRHGNFFKAIENTIKTGGSIKRYGRGLKRRTYIHVFELCQILKFIALQEVHLSRPALALNLGYSDAYSVTEIIDIVARLTETPIIEVPLEVDRSELDIRTMQTSILHGYKPSWNTFHEALVAYVDELQTLRN